MCASSWIANGLRTTFVDGVESPLAYRGVHGRSFTLGVLMRSNNSLQRTVIDKVHAPDPHMVLIALGIAPGRRRAAAELGR